jgi:ABC-type glycerol-3-phosphate transport system substrate-binding protein
MSKFQAILTAIFIVFAIIGVGLFATYKGDSLKTELPTISVWGTFPSRVFIDYVGKINATRSVQLKVDYTEIPESNFDKVFIEALARGQGPDVILVSQDLVSRYADKITVIPPTAITERDFKNNFIQQAELYLVPGGTIALPFVIDPIVMYWNRDSFVNAGIPTYPKYWDEFNNLNSKLTIKDVNSNVRRSAIAMGEFTNILHAREILGTLFLQSGNPITYKSDNTTNGQIALASALGTRGFDGTRTSKSALDFFTQFSNPTDPNYSWNRSMANSKSSFLSGNLATYFGFASEISDLRNKNSNLNFDIAPIPQARGAKNRATYGSMYGFSIVRSSKDPASAFTVISSLTASDALVEMVNISYLPPVKVDIISYGTTDPYLSIFYDSAIISKGWLDTNKADSTKLFKDIVESVTSGKKSVMQALQEGSDEYDILLRNI